MNKYIAIITFAMALAYCGDAKSKYAGLAKDAKGGDKEALQEILSAVQKGESSDLRAAAASSLKGIVDDEIATVLWKRYKVEDDTVRPAILSALYYAPTAKIFAKMKQTYYSKKSTEESKIICLEGFGRSQLKGAHAILRAAAWSKPEKKMLETTDMPTDPDDIEEESDSDSESNTTAGENEPEVHYDEENNPFVWEYKPNALQNTAIKVIGDNKIAGARGTLHGVLNKKRYPDDAVALSVIEALAKIGNKDSFWFIKKYHKENGVLLDDGERLRLAKAMATYEKPNHHAAAAVIFRLHAQSEGEGAKEKMKNLLGDMNLDAKYAVCKPKVLNIRKTGTIRGKKMGSCSKGDAFRILKKGDIKQQIDGQDDYWYQVQVGKKTGWLFGYYIEILDFT